MPIANNPRETAMAFGVSAIALASLRGIGRERVAEILEACADEIRREVLTTDLIHTKEGQG